MVYEFLVPECRNATLSTRKEWILTNGIGGFAMGTVAGANERRYHGYLIAAVQPPAERMLLLGTIDATIQGDGNPHGISCNQYSGTYYPDGHLSMTSCLISNEFVIWDFEVEGMKARRSLTIHPGENAVTATFTNMGPKPFQLSLRPLVCHRDYHGNFREQPEYPDECVFEREFTSVTHFGRTLYLNHPRAQRLPSQGWYYRFEHEREIERGLDPIDDLYTPCELRYELREGESAHVVASYEHLVQPKLLADPILPKRAPQLREQLVEASKIFYVKSEDRATIIAGYPWFTDWGRDTMISLPGVCLHTGMVQQAREILLDFGKHRQRGLIPNRFPEDGGKLPYNTVDASLWYANAAYKTFQAEWTDDFAQEMYKILKDIADWHIKGTDFGIKMCDDTLLTQGEEGVQLTWMDAKIGDWVVTPRHGKPVEINGLWINLLRILEWLGEKIGQDATKYGELATKAESSFEEKFWHPSLGFYKDTVEPDDASLRPNQVLAMALPFSPVAGDRAVKALEKVSLHLLTPAGLRTLAPYEPGYIAQFTGTMEERDAAYHQGTVWPWLMGSYITALVKLTGDKKEAKRILRACKSQLLEYGVGGVAEVYDGDAPQVPGGCPWQAWSVAELLRCLVEDVED